MPVTREAVQSLREMSATAVTNALKDANVETVGALYIGNMISGRLCSQNQLGAFTAMAAGLRGIEAVSVEAACGSGAAAARWGFMAVSGGFHDSVVVAGIEMMTHMSREETTTALATASDWEAEGALGETFVSLNSKIMSAYMAKYGISGDAFGGFPITAHENACGNPNALFHKRIDNEAYLKSAHINGPLRLFDASPICNGSAALVLGNRKMALAAQRAGKPVVQITASAMGTDSLGLRERHDQLVLEGMRRSVQAAYTQAGVGPDDIDLFELHDAYSIMATLSVEMAGFAEPGKGTWLARDGDIRRDGRIPICTMGGLKARGHPVGASGIYQMVEAYHQLAERAGENQIANARIAMAQNIGGTGATVVTHILERTH